MNQGSSRTLTRLSSYNKAPLSLTCQSHSGKVWQSVQLIGRIPTGVTVEVYDGPAQRIFGASDRAGTFRASMSRRVETRLLHFRNWSTPEDPKELGSSDPNHLGTEGVPAEEHANWYIPSWLAAREPEQERPGEPRPAGRNQTFFALA